LTGRRYRTTVPLRHDAARDLCRHAFLPKITENPCEFIDRRGGHDLGRAPAASSHAHVQGPVAAKREAAAGVVQLHRGDAEVREDSVRRGVRVAFEDRVQVREVALDERDAVAEAREALSCERERVRIAVDAEDARAIAARQDSRRVASRAERRVDEEPAALRREQANDVVEENGSVRRGFNGRDLLGSRLAAHSKSLDSSS
jgi:hypothetical protein